MTPGSAAAPGQVTSNKCSYTATWAGLGPPPPPATPFRCIDNKCQPSAPGLPGLDNQTCAQTCGPLSGCLPVLYKLCQADKAKGVSMTDSSSDPVPHARRHTQPSPAPLPHLTWLCTPEARTNPRSFAHYVLTADRPHTRMHTTCRGLRTASFVPAATSWRCGLPVARPTTSSPFAAAAARPDV
jgi:hypothetical protein